MSNKPIMESERMRSFGRVQARKLSKDQQWHVDNILPKVTVSEQDALDLPSLFDKNISKYCIEIGFGKGEHLAGYAKIREDVGFIGCEPFINGVASLLRYIHQNNMDNIKIMRGDARIFLEKLPDNAIDHIMILFPDPWPKLRHHKKRLINDNMLNQICRVLKPGGFVELATDHAEYGDWIFEHLEKCKGLKKVRVSEEPPEDWVRTNYQEKAERQGRGARFFKYSLVL